MGPVWALTGEHAVVELRHSAIGLHSSISSAEQPSHSKRVGVWLQFALSVSGDPI